MEAGKEVQRVESRLQIKTEPGVDLNKVLVTALVLPEETTLLPYTVVEDEAASDCITLGPDSDIEEINKEDVRKTLKDLADLKKQEAGCLERLSEAIPDMQDHDITIVGEKVRGLEMPECV